MAASIRIDQVGLLPGANGKARTDGLDNGAEVTLTNVGGTATTTRFRLLWVPPGDTTSLVTLASAGPGTWTFTPTPGVYGSWLVECVENEGEPTESRSRRIFGVRLPSSGLLIPALNEVADPRATIASLVGGPEAERSDDNAQDYTGPLASELNALPFAGWWRKMHELYQAVEDGGGGGGVSDGKLKVSFDDTSPDFLTNKLGANVGIQGVVLNPGGPEFLQLRSHAAAQRSWSFELSTVDGEPGTTSFRMNNATQDASTFLYVHDISGPNNTDVRPALQALKVGGYMLLQQLDNSSRWKLVRITAVPQGGATDYVRIPIVVERSGGADFTPNVPISFAFFDTGTSIAATTGGVEVFNIAAADAASPIYGGPTGGAGNTYLSLVVPPATFVATKLSCFVTQTAGSLDNIRMGVYDLTGNRLASTVDGTPAVGINELALTAPFQFTGGGTYYLALASRENGCQFLDVAAKWAGAGMAVGLLEPNTYVPASVGTSNKQTIRYWGAAIS